MKGIFTGILNISISAGILIVVCIIIRMLFKNMPKFVRCLMWLLVAIRLAVPFSIESPFSMLPAKEYVTAVAMGSWLQILTSCMAGQFIIQGKWMFTGIAIAFQCLVIVIILLKRDWFISRID